MTSEQKIERGIDRQPVKFRKLALKVFAGDAPPSQAIKLNCIACMGGDIREVKRCDNESCSLHKYRPFQPPRKRARKARIGAPMIEPTLRMASSQRNAFGAITTLKLDR